MAQQIPTATDPAASPTQLLSAAEDTPKSASYEGRTVMVLVMVPVLPKGWAA